MTYVIAEPCIDEKDKSCIDVCPVDCIIETERQLVIDPTECIASPHELESARGDQARIAGAGADEPDGHDSDLDTSFSKYSLRAS